MNINQYKSYWELITKTIIKPPIIKSNIINPNKQSIIDSNKYETNIKFNYKSIIYNRQTIILPFQNNQSINLTIITSSNTHFINHKWIILYLHPQSSSKIQAFTLIKHLNQQFSLACFDFIGYGNNNSPSQNYVTLGFNQTKQVNIAIQYLQNKGYHVILWGRSMGAFAALKYNQKKIIIADSPFYRLQNVCKQFILQHKPKLTPECLISCMFPWLFCLIRKQVKKKAHYDIKNLNLKKFVQKINKDTLLILLSGKNDGLINIKHSQKLLNMFQGKNKLLISFDKGHNEQRPEDKIEQIFKQIKSYISNLKIQSTSSAKLQNVDERKTAQNSLNQLTSEQA